MALIARSIALTIVLSLLLCGPLVALAPAQQPAQPDLMQESLKTSGTTAYDVGAGLANVAYVPGKMVLCGIGAAVGAGLLAVTFGSGYKAATAIAEDGCGGKWALRGDDLRPVPSAEDAEGPK